MASGVQRRSPISPARNRPNLTVLVGAYVDRFIVKGNRIEGLIYSDQGLQKTVQASKEFILSAGAINSPQILLKSGIGPEDHLKEVGVKTTVKLDGVGQNLQDHATMVLQFKSLKSFEMHRLNNPIKKLSVGMNWLLRRQGIATSHIWEAGGLVRSHDNAERPDIQYHFGPTGFEEIGNRFEVTQGFSFHIDQLHPKSHGHIDLTRNILMARLS